MKLLNALLAGASTAIAAAAVLGLWSPWVVPAAVLSGVVRYAWPSGSNDLRLPWWLWVGIAGNVVLLLRSTDLYFRRPGMVLALFVITAFAVRYEQLLLLTFGVVVLGVVTRTLVNPALAVVWGFFALAYLVVMDSSEVAQLPGLDGGMRRIRPARLVARVALALIVVMLLAPVAAAYSPSPSNDGNNPFEGGLGDPGDATGRYVVASDVLDVTDRPDWGDLDAVVLNVEADVPALWRSQAFSAWDGRRWTDPQEIREVVNYGGLVYLSAPDQEVPSSGPPTTTLTQRVTVRTPYLETIVAAATPRTVTTSAPVIEEHVGGTVELPVGLGEGATYVVDSTRVLATEDMLRNPPDVNSYAQGAYDLYLEPYLELPRRVPSRVRQLADQLQQGTTNTYDLVQAVHDWMGENTEYTRELPPLPPGADPVEQHLFVDRKGWCEQIATSSAVLLRAAGVPARLATGFAPGDRSPFGNEFTVRAGDAHAWVEVWFDGVGWQSFDPTASVPLAGEYEDSWLRRVFRALGGLLPWILFLAGLAVAVAMGTAVWDRIAARRRRSWTSAMVDRLERAGRRRGVPRQPSTTVAEYATVLGGTVLAHPDLAGAGATITAAMYGNEGVAEQERLRVARVLRDAARQNPPPRWWRRRR